MTLDSTGKRAYTTVVASKEVDIASSNTLRTDLEQAIKANACVAVDLSHVGFIDSTGLSALLASHNLAEQYGGSLVVLGPDERTLKLLRITQLDQVLHIYATLDDIPEP
jgi:anti-sigma B factor antagonist